MGSAKQLKAFLIGIDTPVNDVGVFARSLSRHIGLNERSRNNFNPSGGLVLEWMSSSAGVAGVWGIDSGAGANPNNNVIRSVW
ncbi:hypothetical protein QPM17_14200 [Marinobacter sp. TBZ242]|uniref:Uncharacterized protein n=1 Tax=Marinobacter azerbaijanicus TaxID=3050455 RepID=A0ABT7IDS1_9GAMM|nr:hypothetical protein [Marinobacter sp. TBZ242]MDL0432294.1 hypothetical protein [Marinobacter sp. TBZ242]